MQDLTQELGGTDIGHATNLGIDTGWITTLFTVAMIVSVVLTIVFIVYLIINISHRWKSEKAMVQMQQDIAEIRRLIEKSMETDRAQRPDLPLVAAVAPEEELS